MQAVVHPIQPMPRMRLGRILLDMGLLTEAELAEVLERQRTSGRRLGELLVAERRLTPLQVGKALARRMGVEFVALIDPPPVELATMLDPAAARRYMALPVRRDDDGTLVVAMEQPNDLTIVDDLQIVLGEAVRPALALPDAIAAHIGVGDAVEALTELTEIEDAPTQTPALDVAAGDAGAPVVRFVNGIVARAVAERASDIHMEPQDGELVIRFRVDGMLRTATRLPHARAAAVVSRVKVMADLDIAERRVPQDGRVGMRVAGRALDVRVATLPTVGGESVVMRLLDQANASLDLDDLGFSETTTARFEAMFTQPNGLVLATGPTGSGKSSTMYAALNRLNTPDRKIVTVEDPVEYRMPGANQVQVRPKAGLTFASGLRAMLRCDPDIILVGEIRDTETAQIAVESALTGHLVLATLHTNDAASAVARLTEMGVEPFLIASSLRGVLAQRLVRRLCTSCATAYVPPAGLIEDFADRYGVDAGPVHEAGSLRRARGCADCGGTGYRARFGVGEALAMSESVERLVLARSAPADIRLQARAEGMQTMLDDGLHAVAAGITSLDELARAIR